MVGRQKQGSQMGRRERAAKQALDGQAVPRDPVQRTGRVEFLVSEVKKGANRVVQWEERSGDVTSRQINMEALGLRVLESTESKDNNRGRQGDSACLGRERWDGRPRCGKDGGGATQRRRREEEKGPPEFCMRRQLSPRCLRSSTIRTVPVLYCIVLHGDSRLVRI